MIRPTPLYLVLVGCGLVLSLLPALLGGALWGVWFGYLMIVLAAGGADLMLMARRRSPHVSLQMPEVLFVGQRDVALVDLEFRGHTRRVRTEALLELEAVLEAPPRQRVLALPQRKTILEFPLVPLRRGTARALQLWLRWTGPFGLFEAVRREPQSLASTITPNTHAVKSAALRFQTTRTFQHGLRPERFVGEGSEFESMREYTPGLDARAIHWKATARHRKLLCQDFRAERNHQVVLGFDTGRLMREPLDGIPKLDHAINAGLLLAYCGLRSGDRVSLFGFDAHVRLWVEPQAGVAAMTRLQKQCATLEYSTEETNFTLGLAELATRLRRRSLIVLLTDFVDTVTSELMLESVHRLVRRHLVLCVALRDPVVDTLATAAPATIRALARSVVAGDLVREREIVLRKLRRLGIDCLDTAPHRLSTGLVNRYLDIKRRERI